MPTSLPKEIFFKSYKLTRKRLHTTPNVVFSCCTSPTWALVLCDQQSSKALRVLAGGDYIDEKKAVSRRKDVSGSEGKSTCSSTLTPNGSCEVRQCLRKLARARSKAGQTISRCSMLYGIQQDGHWEGGELVNQWR